MPNLREYDAAADKFCNQYTGSEKASDLEQHLLGKFPSITRPDLTKVMNSYVAVSDPPSTSIPLAASRNEWYKFDRLCTCGSK